MFITQIMITHPTVKIVGLEGAGAIAAYCQVIVVGAFGEMPKPL
jgi:hypothetical protein